MSDDDVNSKGEEHPFAGLEPIGDTKVAAGHGIAAVALNMAIKYHDSTVVKDGTMYQQYKMEGRNMRELDLDTVFETAMRIERHLLTAPGRVSKMMEELIADVIDEAAPDWKPCLTDPPTEDGFYVVAGVNAEDDTATKLTTEKFEDGAWPQGVSPDDVYYHLKFDKQESADIFRNRCTVNFTK
jgi:hypothetical protein